MHTYVISIEDIGIYIYICFFVVVMCSWYTNCKNEL